MEHMRRFRFLEAAGVFFVTAGVYTLNYMHIWAGYAHWTAMIGAANGSAWEQTKTLALPFVFYSVLEFFVTDIPFKRYFAAKAAGLASVYAVLFAFSLIYPGDLYFVDAVSVVVWAALAFSVSYRLTSGKRIKPEKHFEQSVFVSGILMFMIFCFTVNPPKTNLFKDPGTGVYGIPKADINKITEYMERYFPFAK